MRIKLTSPYLYRALAIVFICFIGHHPKDFRYLVGTYQDCEKGITEPLIIFKNLVNHKQISNAFSILISISNCWELAFSGRTACLL
jgi:hypothetical protein